MIQFSRWSIESKALVQRLTHPFRGEIQYDAPGGTTARAECVEEQSKPNDSAFKNVHFALFNSFI